MKQEKMNYITQFFYKLTLPPTQIAVIIFTMAAVIFIARITFEKFVNFESTGKLQMITPQKIKDWRGDPAQVKVGFHIRNFPSFDFVANNFIIDGIVWFEYDPSLIALETISKFSFDKGELIYKSEPNTKMTGDKFFARFDIRLRFRIDLNYRLFPFDNHRMSIVLVNRFVPPSELVFISKPSFFSISPDIDFQGWKKQHKSVITGYSESALEEDDQTKNILNPEVIFSLDFNRLGIRYISLIIFPLCIIFFFGLLSFAFDPKDNVNLIIALATGAITSLLSYRFVIESLTPRVGYFVFSDYIYLALLGFSVLEFIFAAIVISTKKLNKFLIVLRGLLFIFFISAFLFTWYYYLYRLIV